MLTNRLLRIDKLLVNIPDTLQGTGSNGEATIDDALAYLLEYRKSERAKDENRHGNFEYMTAVIPDGMNPEDPLSMTTDSLLEFLCHNPVHISGVAAMVIRDFNIDESGPYRNIYNVNEMEQFKAMLTAFKGEAVRPIPDTQSEEDQNKNDNSFENQNRMLANHHCRGCDKICDENCPDYEGNSHYKPTDETHE